MSQSHSLENFSVKSVKGDILIEIRGRSSFHSNGPDDDSYEVLTIMCRFHFLRIFRMPDKTFQPCSMVFTGFLPAAG